MWFFLTFMLCFVCLYSEREPSSVQLWQKLKLKNLWLKKNDVSLLAMSRVIFIWVRLSFPWSFIIFSSFRSIDLCRTIIVIVVLYSLANVGWRLLLSLNACRKRWITLMSQGVQLYVMVNIVMKLELPHLGIDLICCYGAEGKLPNFLNPAILQCLMF